MITNSAPLNSGLNPMRGEIWQVEFDPAKGEEIKKARPAVVISSDAFKPLKTKLVVPLTTWQDRFANSQWMVKVVADKTNGLSRDSAADALQLRCVSFERFTRKLGVVPVSLLAEIAAAVAIVIEFE